MEYLQSSQTFIRALKAPSDPPSAGGPTKLAIATEAWRTPSFRAPNKDEVIAEWVLGKFLKERTKPLEANPLASSDYWNLLADIVAASDDTSQTNSCNRPLKVWLAPLLHRIALAPILTAYLSVSSTLESGNKAHLDSTVHPCLQILWPLASPKMTADTMLDIFGAALRSLHASCRPTVQAVEQAGIIKISSMISSTYRPSLSVASNKKKLYANFVAQYLPRWFELVALAPQTASYEILVEVYAIGSEMLFNADTLRSMREGKGEANLFDAVGKMLSSTSPSVLAVLPRVFESFIQATRKHRSSITVQVHHETSIDTSEHLRKVAMVFFSSCYACISQAGNVEDVWRARVALLQTVDSERLFSYQDHDAEGILMDNADMAYKSLASADRSSRALQRVAMEALTIITRIDYDLVAPVLPGLLPMMFIMEAELAPAAHSLLALLLEYHTKTRTMPDYVRSLLSALSHKGISQPVEVTYRSLFGGPVLNIIHLDRLRKALESFTTPGQVFELCSETLNALQTTLQSFRDSHPGDDEAPRKKRKTSKGTSASMSSDGAALAVIVAILARFAAIIIPSLRIKILPRLVQDTLRNQIAEYLTDIVYPALKQALKMIGKSGNPKETWHWQTVATALLRYHYDICGRPYPLVSADRDRNQKLGEKLLRIITSDQFNPEATVVGFHWLLGMNTPETPLAASLFDAALVWLRTSMTPDLRWSGFLSDLSQSTERNTAATALLHLLLTRRLPEVETLLSDEQLKQFARVLLFIQPSQKSASQDIQAREVHARALRSAQLWELRRLRDAILSVIVDETKEIDTSCLATALDNETTRLPILTEWSDALQASCICLLYAPAEWLPRTTRVDMSRKALLADVLLLRETECRLDAKSVQALIVFRAFISRSGSFLEALGYEEVVNATKYFTMPLDTRSSPLDALSSITVDITQQCFLALLHRAEEGDAGIPSVIEHLLATCFSKSRKAPGSTGPNLLQNLLLLIDILVSNFSREKFPDETIKSFLVLHCKLRKRIQPSMDKLLGDTSPVQADYAPVQAWCRLLALGRWLQLDTELLEYGRRMVSKLAHSPGNIQVAESILHLLMEELRSATSEKRIPGLERLLASYVLLMRALNDGKSSQTMETALSKTWRDLTVSEYSHVLGMVAEAAMGASDSSPDSLNFLTISMQLLHDSPEGTLKVTQHHIGSWLSIVVNRYEIWLAHPDLRLKVLELLGRQCSDRPASLRPVDMHCLLSLLSRLLAPSSSHDANTSVATYHSLVSILSALVRLRRDLVTAVLPHLGHLLRRFLSILRQPRSQLGAKQTRMITDTLPAWIGPSGSPLGAAEARALARLLTNLTTKTVVRTFASRDPAESAAPAASLARAFSKHAAPVVRAYVDTLTDPLCVLSADVRRELEPGLFALCEMISEHVRDAMVASALDASGKVVLKNLWKEYEKQRYVGKG